jgi:ribonuclease D
MKAFETIDSDQKLQQYCSKINQADVCYIDTEFVREKTYYPVLALIQISTDDTLACIDPLVIEDFSPLSELLVNPRLLKVFHSPDQDLEILHQVLNVIPQPIFDTQLAATVLGYQHQISYAELVRLITGTELEKKHTRADWSRRPLTDSELDYAMDDVVYLIPVYKEIQHQLTLKNRWAWIKQDLAALSDPDSYHVDLDGLWKKLKGINKLKGNQLEIARQLSVWREQRAQQSDRPKRWILKDEVIIDIARLKPVTIDELSGVRDLGDKLIERNGAALLELIENAATVAAEDWPILQKIKPLSQDQQTIADGLMAICRMVAEQNNLSVSTLTTRKDIEKLIVNRKGSPLLEGWRQEMVGDKLLSFLHGQIALGVKNFQPFLYEIAPSK